MATTSCKILLIGATGFFGKRIAERIARIDGIELSLCARNEAQLDQLRARILSHARCVEIKIAAFDLASIALVDFIKTQQFSLVIHLAGPFQSQDFSVARACIAAQTHYLDLADSRQFVKQIETLDQAAKLAGCSVLSGASTVPCLSAAVVHALSNSMDKITAIHCGISPGNRSERGIATVSAILAYVGKPILHFSGGKMQSSFGWQALTRHRFSAPVGIRWLSFCEVPDLDLFPSQYEALQEQSFRAGLELSSLHLGLWFLSGFARLGWVKDWSKYARILHRASQWFERFGSESGAMFVDVIGLDANGKAIGQRWEIIATKGDGPQIPCTAAVIFAQKFAQGWRPFVGARACINELSLADFEQAFGQFHLRTSIRDLAQ